MFHNKYTWGARGFDSRTEYGRTLCVIHIVLFRVCLPIVATPRCNVYVILYVCNSTHDTGENPIVEQRLNKIVPTFYLGINEQHTGIQFINTEDTTLPTSYGMKFSIAE